MYEKEVVEILDVISKIENRYWIKRDSDFVLKLEDYEIKVYRVTTPSLNTKYYYDFDGIQYDIYAAEVKYIELYYHFEGVKIAEYKNKLASIKQALVNFHGANG